MPTDMNKTDLLQQIIAQLAHDLAVLFTAAKTAHEASIHAENIADNKYATLALEASYVAQGQANRAGEIRKAIEVYKQMAPRLPGGEEIRLGTLVTLEGADGATKAVFIGPLAGGLKIVQQGQEVVVITPASPMGRELLGKTVGDTVTTGEVAYEIVTVC